MAKTKILPKNSSPFTSFSIYFYTHSIEEIMEG